MIQIMFEAFNVPSNYSAQTANLCLDAFRRTIGIVFDAGEGASHVVPIYEYYYLRYASMKFNIGGGILTDWLRKIHNERSYSFTTATEREVVHDIKEKLSYVALDFDDEVQKAKISVECDASYSLPDGRDITIADERFRCTELLFKPNLNGFVFDGIDRIIFELHHEMQIRYS